MPVTGWSDEKLILLYCPGRGSNSRPSSVVTIPNFATRYVSRYLGHDAIHIAILVYRVSQCLDLQFAYYGNAYA